MTLKMCFVKAADAACHNCLKQQSLALLTEHLSISGVSLIHINYTSGMIKKKSVSEHRPPVKLMRFPVRLVGHWGT